MAIEVSKAKRLEDVFEHAQFTGLRNTVPPSRFDLGDLSTALKIGRAHV